MARKILFAIILLALLPSWAIARNDINGDSFLSRGVDFAHLYVDCTPTSALGSCAPQKSGVWINVTNGQSSPSGCLGGGSGAWAFLIGSTWHCIDKDSGTSGGGGSSNPPGDGTNSVQINAGSGMFGGVPLGPDTVLQGSATAPGAANLPNCATSLNYSTGTHLFGCTALAAVALSGSAADLTTGLLPWQRLPTPTYTTLGGIQATLGGGPHQWIKTITSSGTTTTTQPDFLDLTGFATVPQGGLGTIVAPTGGQIPVAQNSSQYLPVSMNGDCTIGTSGQIVCLSTNGVPFGPLATSTSPCSIANGCTGATTANAAYNGLSPMTTPGDMEYEAAGPIAARLAGNTTATRKFLTMTSSAPAWLTIASADLTTALTTAPPISGTTGTFSGAVVAGSLRDTGQTSGCAQFDGSGNMTSTGVGCAGGGPNYPNGSPVQITGYSGVNTSEAETVSGDGTFARPGANSYVLTITKSNGNLFTSSAFGATLDLSSLFSQDATVTSGGVVTVAKAGNGTGPLTLGRASFTEAAAPSGSAGQDALYGDSTAHRLKMKNNNGAAVQVVGSGVDIDPSDQVIATHLTVGLPPTQGGLGTTTAPTTAQIPIAGPGFPSTQYVPTTVSGDASLATNGSVAVNHWTLTTDSSAGSHRITSLLAPTTTGDALSEGRAIGAITPVPVLASIGTLSLAATTGDGTDKIVGANGVHDLESNVGAWNPTKNFTPLSCVFNGTTTATCASVGASALKVGGYFAAPQAGPTPSVSTPAGVTITPVTGDPSMSSGPSSLAPIKAGCTAQTVYAWCPHSGSKTCQVSNWTAFEPGNVVSIAGQTGGTSTTQFTIAANGIGLDTLTFTVDPTTNTACGGGGSCTPGLVTIVGGSCSTTRRASIFAIDKFHAKSAASTIVQTTVGPNALNWGNLLLVQNSTWDPNALTYGYCGSEGAGSTPVLRNVTTPTYSADVHTNTAPFNADLFQNSAAKVFPTNVSFYDVGMPNAVDLIDGTTCPLTAKNGTLYGKVTSIVGTAVTFTNTYSTAIQTGTFSVYTNDGPVIQSAVNQPCTLIGAGPHVACGTTNLSRGKYPIFDTPSTITTASACGGGNTLVSRGAGITMLRQVGSRLEGSTSGNATSAVQFANTGTTELVPMELGMTVLELNQVFAPELSNFTIAPDGSVGGSTPGRGINIDQYDPGDGSGCLVTTSRPTITNVHTGAAHIGLQLANINTGNIEHGRVTGSMIGPWGQGIYLYEDIAVQLNSSNALNWQFDEVDTGSSIGWLDSGGAGFQRINSNCAGPGATCMWNMIGYGHPISVLNGRDEHLAREYFCPGGFSQSAGQTLNIKGLQMPDAIPPTDGMFFVLASQAQFSMEASPFATAAADAASDFVTNLFPSGVIFANNAPSIRLKQNLWRMPWISGGKCTAAALGHIGGSNSASEENDQCITSTGALTVGGWFQGQGGGDVGMVIGGGVPQGYGTLLVNQGLYTAVAGKVIDAAGNMFNQCSGQVALVSGTPSTATVSNSCFTASSNVVICTNGTSTGNIKCVAGSGTLTITGPNSVTDTINYARLK